MRSADGGFAQTRQALNRFPALFGRGRLAGFRAFFLGAFLAGAAYAADTGDGPRAYLWVVRDALDDSVRFAALADSAHAVGITDLVVQVRGRGEAYYRSATEPAPRALEIDASRGAQAGDRPSEVVLRFDPLASAMRAARDRGMRVHAWMNVFLSGDWRRPGQAHVISRHPDWRIRARDGKAFDEYAKSRRSELPIEGVYLSPGNPAVRDYLAGVAAEIAQRYAVDGIHLDYVRYPYLDAGYDEASLAAYRRARPGGRPQGEGWDDWRQAQVSAAVREIAAAVRAARPGIEVSAAVLPDPVDARRSCMQDWPGWIHEGSVDRVLTMAYCVSEDRFDFWIRIAEAEVADRGRIVPGIGLHKAHGSTVDPQLRVLRERSRRDLAIFSDVELLASSQARAAIRRFVRESARVGAD